MTGVPARPAAYIRDADATNADDPNLTERRDVVISLVQELGWPVPAVYADAGQPGSQLAALGGRSPPAGTMPCSPPTRW